MIRALYSSASAMVAQQQNLDIISNNIANINTVAYKKVRPAFQDALYSAMDARRAPEPVNLQVGNGVRVAATQRHFRHGRLQETGRTLDFAIDGEGFFVLLRPDGTLCYTRDGSFQISTEQVGGVMVNRLVTPQGEYVLDINGQPMEVYNGQEVPVDRFNIAVFPNPEGLEAIGYNRFVETEASGPAMNGYPAVVRQGFLELSNVDLAEEMAQLILAQRAYQLSSRVLQSADEMERLANNLRE
ncbi:flagellar hook-basal body protein [Caldicoprobacter faecalis]|uniref:Flagellar basal-body rod protein FlgG n=1 Tax=Caldicoprobacter faecalis TaxID=937334 RepID=A0A1I5XCS1_9FIRM|nr:flagellar hook-basal body protein [Caldicoprobacter faecalis]SFQ29447.1 flagellar basal-body rod protein FlgG [Caldicoprobacter faecalis]